MDWIWTYDRRQVGTALDGRRIIRKSGDRDWIENNRGGRTQFDAKPMGKVFRGFIDLELVVLAADKRWEWTDLGLSLWRPELDRRTATVQVA